MENLPEFDLMHNPLVIDHDQVRRRSSRNSRSSIIVPPMLRSSSPTSVYLDNKFIEPVMLEKEKVPIIKRAKKKRLVTQDSSQFVPQSESTVLPVSSITTNTTDMKVPDGSSFLPPMNKENDSELLYDCLFSSDFKYNQHSSLCSSGSSLSSVEGVTTSRKGRYTRGCFTSEWVSGSDSEAETYSCNGLMQGQLYDDNDDNNGKPPIAFPQTIPTLNEEQLDRILSCNEVYWFSQMNYFIKQGTAETITNILSEAGAKSFGQTAYKELFQLVATLMILRLISVNFPEKLETQWLHQKITTVKCHEEHSGKFSRAIQLCQDLLNRRPDMLVSLELGSSIQDIIDGILKQCF